jgi:hypothetical protein
MRRKGAGELFTLQPVQRGNAVLRTTALERWKNGVRRLRVGCGSKALIAFEGRLAQVDVLRRGALLREVRLLDEWVDGDTGVYCAGMAGRVMPFEVYTFLAWCLRLCLRRCPPPRRLPSLGVRCRFWMWRRKGRCL